MNKCMNKCMNNLRTLSSCRNLSPYFFIMHLLHRLYGVDAPVLGNKGPKATYKSQYTIFNDYSPRQCTQYIKKIMRRKKQFTNYVKFSLQYNKR